MARKFLYFIAIMVVALLGLLFALNFWADDLTELTFVPTAQFTDEPALAANVYEKPEMWISRPGLGAQQDPARWLPDGFTEAGGTDSGPLGAAVFFIHPTSYLEKERWNAPLDDPEARDRAELFVRGMASPFNRSQDLWAPRYRQATIGAFLTEAPEAGQALDMAYGDVLQAFDYFVESIDNDTPIILAGHSQGAFHLRRLIHDRVAGKPLAKRIVAAYVIGWPVSLQHDLPEMGLPACAGPDQAGCVMSWISFAEPADNAMLVKSFGHRPGLDGQPLAGSPFLCTNPLTGAAAGPAAAAANLGTLVPDVEARTGKLVPGMVPARCGDDGFLYIGDPPKLGPYVLPGNNYHLYDIPLFWANLRADVAARVKAWKAGA
jgi:hypothetical protein